MTEGDAQDPLRDLGRRLEAAQRAREGNARRGSPGLGASSVGEALALAWRIGLELVVAVVVGTALGWAIDRWLGTKPWGMIVLFFLGVAAGMMNVWRTVTGMSGAVGFRREGGAGATNERDDED